MKFERLPVWMQKVAVFGAVVVFVLRYSYSRKFRESVDRTMTQVAGFVPALFKGDKQ